MKCSTKYLCLGARNIMACPCDLTNLTLSIKKQEPHAFETIPACETARKVQAEHLFAGKGAWGVEAGHPKAIHAIWNKQKTKWGCVVSTYGALIQFFLWIDETQVPDHHMAVQRWMECMVLHSAVAAGN